MYILIKWLKGGEIFFLFLFFLGFGLRIFFFFFLRNHLFYFLINNIFYLGVVFFFLLGIIWGWFNLRGKLGVRIWNNGGKACGLTARGVLCWRYQKWSGLCNVWHGPDWSNNTLPSLHHSHRVSISVSDS